MRAPCRREFALTLVAVLLTAGAVHSVPAQENEPLRDPLVSIDLAKSHLGYTFIGEAGVRYFVSEVVLTNLTDRDLVIPIDAFTLLADGIVYAPDIEHPKLTGYEFRVGGTSYRFRELEQTRSISLSAGSSSSAWVVFTGLPKTPDVPRLVLQLVVDSVRHRVDVTEHYLVALKLRLERIGPHEALGLLTIDGLLNTISVGSLVDTINQLGAAGITRVVVVFGQDAVPLDEPLGSWLRQTAENIQTSRTYAMFPAVLSTIREFHVANLPGDVSDTGGQHIHSSAARAVEDALESAYRGLTSGEIAHQIEQGHPLAQASALVSGGAQLPADYLPLLIEKSESSQTLLRRGALIALSGFGDPQAVSLLERHARSSDAATARLAVECLASSRFPQAHRSLEQLLRSDLAVSDVDLVQILSRYPRRKWADYLFDMAHSTHVSFSSTTHREVVAALGRIGHPRLAEVLAHALKSSDTNVRQTAFQLLLARDDDASEQLALDYALRQLELAPPTPPMLQLFDRLRDPRVPPLLLKYLDEPKGDRSAIINTLARIGPSTIDEQLARRFDNLKPHEQATVLTNLTQLRSSRLPQLAERGLSSEHDAVFNTAVRSLGLTADETAIELLSDRLGAETEIGRVSTLAKALEDIGLPAATRALEAAKNSSESDKRSAIAKRLQALQLKSPGGQHLRRAEHYVQQEDHEKAVLHYTAAIKRDPELAQAYSGRGHSLLKLEDYQQAEDDFRQGCELDPDDGLAVAGLGITLAISGEIEEAVATIERASDRFPKDLLFAYNAACVYGRALEKLDDGSAGNRRRKREYEEAALLLLEKSVELGFDDREWMRQDPDLASLRDLVRFQTLVRPADAPGEEKIVPEEAPAESPAPRSNPPEPGEQ